MQVSHDFVQKIKASITISEFLQKYLHIIPSGHNRYKALCPFHNEKTPSFIINDDRQLYHCFGCNAHGDVISFLVDKEGYSFVDAVKYLADYVGMAIPQSFYDEKVRVKDKEDYEILMEIKDFFKSQLSQYPEINKYLRSRNLSAELIERFEIGYAPDSKIMDQFVANKRYNINKLVELGVYKISANQKPYLLFHNRIIFPIYNHFGQVVAFGGRIIGQGQPKYLNSPEHRFFKKRDILFNLYHAKSAIKKVKTAVICEGYMDVIALHKHGMENAVAPLGTAFSESHLQVLWKYADKPVMCLDGDDAGRKAMIRAAHIAIPYLQPGKTLLFAILPQGKDPDDLLQEEEGEEKLQKLLNEQAVSLGEIIIAEVMRNRSADLPEERANIMQELNNYADKISNKLVKKQYLQYFNQACFHLFRQKKFSFAKVQYNIRLRESKVSQKELDLVLFICFNIAELQKENIEEEFSLIEFSHEELIKIQMYLLANTENFDIKQFEIWLAQNVTELKNIIIQKIKDHISAIDIDDNYKEGQWDFFYKSYYLEKLQNDYRLLCDDEEHEKAVDVHNNIKKLYDELNDLQFQE